VRFLLDTHFVYWIPADDRRISTKLRRLLEDPANEFVFSVVNLWEMSIKRSQSKSAYSVDPRDLRRYMLANRYEELPITGAHAVAIDALPPIHKDPFDRILIAQAIVEGITLLTEDATIALYPGPIRKV
jgi:PIN domain nuclease of toxin-antitoxin system